MVEFYIIVNDNYTTYDYLKLNKSFSSDYKQNYCTNVVENFSPISYYITILLPFINNYFASLTL